MDSSATNLLFPRWLVGPLEMKSHFTIHTLGRYSVVTL
jgi:hypothetical protein